MSKVQKSSKAIPELAVKGMPFMAGAGQVGVAIQHAKVTLAGASHPVDLAAIGLTPMADTTYCVIVDGEFAGAVSVDESTITAAGFTIIGGAAAEVAHVLVVGRMVGMLSSSGSI